jgi:hypothetical protein
VPIPLEKIVPKHAHVTCKSLMNRTSRQKNATQPVFDKVVLPQKWGAHAIKESRPLPIDKIQIPVTIELFTDM